MRVRGERKWKQRDLRIALPSTKNTKVWGAVAVTGRGLIAAGLLLFGFVAYQLWGTGIETARAQRALSTEFELLLTSPETEQVTTTPVTTTPGSEGGAAEVPTPPPPVVGASLQLALGDPVARIQIPRIKVDDIVVAGVGSSELQLGPGHFPDTVPPGHLGNAAIAGHRTTYGQPFRNVDRLQPGDEIYATTREGSFTYRVTQTRIVSPSDYFVVFTTKPDEAQLTLVSCHPVWSTAQRIIVSASLVPEKSSPARDPLRYQVIESASDPLIDVEPTTEDETAFSDDLRPIATDPNATGTGSTGTGPESSSASSAAPAALAEPITDAFAEGWFHDRDAIPQLALWGALLTLVSLLSHRASVLMRSDLVGFAGGVLPFSMSLYFFFQNFHRLVPPGL